MPIWNFHLKLRSKHSADLKLWSKHNEKNADLSTARGTPIQAWREERQSKHTYPPQAPIYSFLSLLVCLCVGVFGFVVSMGDFVVDFVVDFWFLWLIFDCLWECVYQRKRRWLCRWRRERKKGAKLEIIKIMYRRATVIVYSSWKFLEEVTHFYLSWCGSFFVQNV